MSARLQEHANTDQHATMCCVALCCICACGVCVCVCCVSAVMCRAVPCRAVPGCAVLCSYMLFCVALFNVTLCRVVLLCGDVWRCACCAVCRARLCCDLCLTCVVCGVCVVLVASRDHLRCVRWRVVILCVCVLRGFCMCFNVFTREVMVCACAYPSVNKTSISLI